MSAARIVLLAVKVGGHLPERIASLLGRHGIHAADLRAFRRAPGLVGRLIWVHRVAHGWQAAGLMLLTPPFVERDCWVAWSSDPQAEARLRRAALRRRWRL